jgi:DNA-binding CsgD family transcriptional regulator
MTQKNNIAPFVQIKNACANAGDELVYFDLDVEGRIISQNAVATDFLNMHPQYVRHNNAAFFVIHPSQPVAEALRAARDRIQPVSSVLTHFDASQSPVLQINVLPLYPDLVRIVLFWVHTNIETPKAIIPALSVREHAVLKLFATGLRRDRIAYRLNISLPTVDMHSRNLRRKLGARTTPEAVAIAGNMQILQT